MPRVPQATRELGLVVDDLRGRQAHGAASSTSATRSPGRAPRQRAPGGRRGRARALPGRAARRVPGHLGRPAAAAHRPLRASGQVIRSPPSATPARRSTAGAGARSATSTRFPSHFPLADGRPARTVHARQNNRTRRPPPEPGQRAVGDAARAPRRASPSSCRAPASELDGRVRVALCDDARRGGRLGRRPGPRPGRPGRALAAGRRRAVRVRTDFAPLHARAGGAAASRSRSSASAACCPARGRRPRRDAGGARRRRPPTPRWCGCSPARAGGSARATSPCSAAGPPTSSRGPAGRDAARREVDRATPTRSIAERRAWRKPSRASTRPRSCRCPRRSSGPAAAAYSRGGPGPFARLAAELRELRRHLGDPLLDLLHRVLATTGLDVEVAAAPLAATRRLTLARSSTTRRRSPTSTATRACARSSPSSRRREEFERGLDTAAPTPARHREADDRAQGQGPGVAGRRAARRDVRACSPARGPAAVDPAPPRRCRPRCAATPPTSRVARSGPPRASRRSRPRTKELDQLEERRLGYVAVTRAKAPAGRHRPLVGPHPEATRAVALPRGDPRALPRRATARSSTGSRSRRRSATRALDRGDDARLAAARPTPTSSPARRTGAELVRAALAGHDGGADEQLDLMPRPGDDVEQSEPASPPGTATWRPCWTRPRRRTGPTRDVPLPASLSASALVRLAADPEGLARDLARPMPRRRPGRQPAAAPASTPGSRRTSARSRCSTARDLRGRGRRRPRSGSTTTWRRCRRLPRRALRRPATAPGRGAVPARPRRAGGPRPHRRRLSARATAATRSSTGRPGAAGADPLQLALYRAAWAQIAGVPEESVGAAFYYVASGRVERPDGLPTADELARAAQLADRRRRPHRDVDDEGAVVAHRERQRLRVAPSSAHPCASTWSNCTRGP